MNTVPWSESFGPRPSEPTAITIGVFDGVHKGHQHVLSVLRESAALRGLVPVVLTFINHPISVLRPGSDVQMLISLNERIELIHDHGIDFVFPMEFTHELSLLSYDEFISTLCSDLGLKHLVVGPDFALGHKREGTVSVLTEFGSTMGFAVEEVKPFLVERQGVRSTRIRNALSQGRVELACSLLGRPFAIEGVIERGEGRGGPILGFPTANLPIPESQAIPADGIYAAWAQSNGTRYAAAVSIGRNPTFGADGTRTIEAHLLNFQGDLYGGSVRIEFMGRIRDHEHFNSTTELAQQMQRDATDTSALLGSATSSGSRDSKLR